ncbi:gamma-glutamyltransferase [Candidatus Bipolaricaulota bacterium]|nr:gamma-glutamyltransferase [Candidatus Bipolaricaulota bacterium]
MLHNRIRRIGSLILVLIVSTFLVLPLSGAEVTEPQRQITTSTGVVASAHRLASKAGAEILAQGGNSVDAAVATSFALGVVEPHASGIGGESMITISLDDGTDTYIDGKTVAPDRDIFNLYRNEETDYGPEATAVPGTVAALTKAQEEYGELSLSEVIQPAIELAREGFPADKTLIQMFSSHDFYKNNVGNSEVASIYFNGGVIPDVGDTISNPYLAKAYELIAEKGAKAFYEGEIADAVEKATEGWITKDDLKAYRAKEMEPVTSDYRGYEVITAAPPVSGVTLSETLNIMEQFDLPQYSYDNPKAIHITAQAKLLASSDRYQYLADPAFWDVPVDVLSSDEYAKERAKWVDPDKRPEWQDKIVEEEDDLWDTPYGNAYKYQEEKVKSAEKSKSGSTTHISVADENGAVSITNTISFFWGSQVYVPGYGFFINNEFHNFLGDAGEINTVVPGARPRTTPAPTIIKKEGRPYLVIGSPGGGRIVTSVADVISGVIDYNMDLASAMKAPKYTCRVWYSGIRTEEHFPKETIEELKNMGNNVRTYDKYDLYFGGPNGVLIPEENKFIGVGSFRRDGAAAGPKDE